MQNVHILVVEDEMILAEDIAMRLTDMGYVVKYVPTVHQALIILKETLSQKQPIDLAIIDIVLQGELDGIDLARYINEQYPIPFIFLTSQADSYFVERAKRVLPAAYMLKPFNDQAIKIAIEMALVNYADRQKENAIDDQALCINDSLFLKQDNFFKRVYLKDILWLKAESNYTLIHTQVGKFMYAVLLHKIGRKLPNQFLRVHRSHIVNMHKVTGYIGNMLYINQETVQVSKRYSGKVFTWFNTL